MVIVGASWQVDDSWRRVAGGDSWRRVGNGVIGQMVVDGARWRAEWSVSSIVNFRAAAFDLHFLPPKKNPSLNFFPSKLFFPFSPFLGSGPGGNRRGRSPVEYRENLYVRLYVRLSICL